MALNLVAASSQCLTSVSANALLSYPFTLLSTASPNATGVAYYIYDCGNNASALSNSFKIRAAGDSANTARITAADGATSDASSTSTNFVASAYQKFTYIGTSSTSRSVLLNNAGITTSAVAMTPTGINNATIGALDLLSVKANFFDGQIAHVCAWNVVLTAAELAQYQAGISPLAIRRSALLFYLPLDTNIIDVTGNTTWTNVNGATFVASNLGTYIPRPWLQ